MAWEQWDIGLGQLVASADLSTKQFYCVKAHTVNNQFALCDTDGEVVLGVLQDKPTSGLAGNIMTVGVTKVIVGEALTAGDKWGTDGVGKAKKTEMTLTGADVGDYFGGVVLEGAAVGELATVTIGMQSGLVELA